MEASHRDHVPAAPSSGPKKKMSAAMAAAMRAAGVDTDAAEASSAAANVPEARPAPPPLPAGWQSHWDIAQKRCAAARCHALPRAATSFYTLLHAAARVARVARCHVRHAVADGQTKNL